MPQEVMVVLIGFLAPLGGLMIVILTFIFNSFKRSIEKNETRSDAQEARITALEEERDGVKKAKEAIEDELVKERADKEARKRERERERQQQKEDIRKLNEQHTRAIEEQVRKAVDDVTRQHQVTIDNLKRENNEAIQEAVQKAVTEAVEPLNLKIQTLTTEKKQAEDSIAHLSQDYETLKQKFDDLRDERDDLQARVVKIEKKDTDKLPPVPSDPASN